MTLINNIEEFFNDYILNYGPYKDNILYQKILQNIFNYYITNSYTNVPTLLQTIFEQQIIPTNLYDNILVSLGLSKTVISKLSLNDKIIIISTLSDFQRYKGSIELIKRLSENFNDDIEIGELFLDYDYYNNFEEKEWMFKSKCITNDNKLPLKFGFDEIYNTIPSFLLSKEELTKLYNNNTIILPIKSNLIYLDITKITILDGLNDFINQYFIYKYGNLLVTLYIDSDTFQIKFKDIPIIWYYLLNKCHNVNFPNTITTDRTNSFSQLSSTDINNIDNIIKTYKSINNINDYTNFYNKYIKPNYTNPVLPKYSSTISDMETYISSNIDSNFLQFILDYLSSSDENVDILILGHNLLTQIYDSILLYNLEKNNDDFNIYLSYFLNNLSQVFTNLKNSNVYLLLSNLKPYHTEIVTNTNNIIQVNDKSDIINPIDKTRILYNLVKSDYQDFIDFSFFKINFTKLIDVNIKDKPIIKILIEKNEEYNKLCLDIYNITINILKNDINLTNDLNYFNIELSELDYNIFIDKSIVNIKPNIESNVYITEQLNLIFPTGFSNIFTINDFKILNINIPKLNYLIFLNNYIIYENYPFKDKYTDLDDNNYQTTNKLSLDLYNIQEFVNIID